MGEKKPLEQPVTKFTLAMSVGVADLPVFSLSVPSVPLVGICILDFFLQWEIAPHAIIDAAATAAKKISDFLTSILLFINFFFIVASLSTHEFAWK